MEHHPQQFMSLPTTQVPTSVPFATDAMYQASMRYQQHPTTHPFQFQHQQAFPTDHIPPTPNSYNMHGEAGRFMQQNQQLDAQQRAMLEQRYQIRKDDAIAFTPMVSPAGTPQYNVQPEFTIPGAYFSPLTSPMLHAQNAAKAHQQTQQHLQGYYTNPSTAPSSNATSPTDPNLDVDMGDAGIALPESATAQSRKPRRKVATPRSAGMNGRVTQSPIQKPQKRKSGTMLSALVPPKEMESLIVEAPKSAKFQPGSAGLHIPAAFQASSDDGSISPEPLSEALMGPPPRPGSAMHHSPVVMAQQQQQHRINGAGVGAAATPKSLLQRNGVQQQLHEAPHHDRGASEPIVLDELQLPEAASQQASQRPALSQINTQIPPAGSAQPTPPRPPSALPSPVVVASPVSASTPGALLKDKKSAFKGPAKKRSSVGAGGSALTSPALRPKISPSIKPLLPEGSSLNSSTHALLLASKSNYQNLLEGNHLPGVTYPDSLSTGLTSKRTSHKVAEQGRRNRINEALKEMQSLLPREYLMGKAKGCGNGDESPETGPGADGDSKESKEDATAKSNSSKAATVESANVYIRNMQKKQQEEAAENLRLRRMLEEMERKLGEQCVVEESTEKRADAVDSASPASAGVKVE
ncbi:hypothetical protein BAUCODRAFT_554017 [Baudoinia panamericana UAMH 10762]|uniref:BHLH domain-containing protein n=1 Tax=Baudoinia panamericana (strain UAMH 10762) TaxID=717646 RepID=M2N747_BAUPA|nr:uncharacterized protein BAUCODRAFT_554017 [Baudoinia panamericana UAMH 10762]EMC94610.1 hypothetical protein BAUCODRAFT_554017 [Baudoinia panamericana UAMH 10762]